MVSAKCCLSYGECAKMCFRGVLKPQNVLKYAGGHFVFIKYGENALEATEAPHCTFSNRARQKLSVFLMVFCILQYG